MKRSLSTVHPEDAEILRLVQNRDRLNTRGTRKLLNRSGSNTEVSHQGRSSEAIGLQIGTSRRMVERCRAVLKYCGRSTIVAILRGQLSITEAYRAAMAERDLRLLAAEVRPPRGILEVLAMILEKGVVKTPKGMNSLGKQDLELVRLVVGHLDAEGLLTGASEPVLRILVKPMTPTNGGAL